jgi:glycerol-3-phosphate acyltransferase PlsY
MLWTIAALLASYLLGSIPTAYLFGRLLKGIDIRKIGSGNVGATNALRVLGKGPGLTVLLLDILKGFITVMFLGNYFVSKPVSLESQNLLLIMGLCCICGHIWTIFLQFKGGKGIATSFGVLLALSLKIYGLNMVIGLVVLVWFIVFIISKIVSLSSIVSAVALPLFCLFLGQSVIVFFSSLLLSILVIVRHKANILRLLKGEEPRINFKKIN